MLEAVADSKWRVDQFLAPVPVRVLLDVRGRDLTDERDALAIAGDAENANLTRFLEQPGFSGAILKSLLVAAKERAQQRVEGLKAAATERAASVLGAEQQRLTDLRKVNDHVRAEEIALAGEQLTRVRDAIDGARLRLDSLRLILEGPGSE